MAMFSRLAQIPNTKSENARAMPVPELASRINDSGYNSAPVMMRLLLPKRETNAADIVEATIGGLNFWNMRFVFHDISHLQNLVDNEVDGLLGFPFFKAGKFSIDYSTKVISIWE